MTLPSCFEIFTGIIPHFSYTAQTIISEGAAHNNSANIYWEELCMNNNTDFIKGMGIGLVAGLSVGMATAPKKNKSNMIGKALRAAGEVADNISNVIAR